MNTSRDIEKLFDHFGGNAGDYQEIGRENEAKNARTRWPLLATLDLAQPAIPEIVQRGEVTPRHAPVASEPEPEAALKPISRGKPPLFARAHRRTIPPVDNAARFDSLSASRFAALAQAVEEETAPVAAQAHVPSIPRITEKTVSAPRQEATHSILGKMFQPQAQPAVTPSTPANSGESLDDVFTRLRQAGTDNNHTTNTGPRRTWGSRS